MVIGDNFEIEEKTKQKLLQMRKKLGTQTINISWPEYRLMFHKLKRTWSKLSPIILKTKENQGTTHLSIFSFHLEILRMVILRGRISGAVNIWLMNRNVDFSQGWRYFK